MRLLVCGGRDYDDSDRVWAVLDRILDAWHPTVLIHGCARGVDSQAETWASARGLKVCGFRAEWQRLGKAAGPIRNQRMLAEGKPDLVVAFPGGAGTADMVRRAVAAGIEVFEVAL